MRRFKMFIALACLFAHANAQFTLSGIIKDENNEALIGANVVIEDTYKGAITNPKGEFLFTNLKNGDYSVNISYLGYNTVNENVTLNKDINLEIIMRPSSYMSEEVIVKAVRASYSDPISRTTIARAEIENNNLGQDLPMLLSMTPSAVVTSDAGAGVGYTGIRIRGNDASRTNVTINGIPMNDAESHGVFWVDIPDFAENVDNIQIQRGIGSSTNGAGAFGSSMNMQTTRFNTTPYAEVKSTIGSFSTYKNTFGIGTGLLGSHITIDGRISLVSSDGYIDRATSDLKSYFVTGGYYSGKDIIKMNFFGGKEITYQAWNGIPKAKLIGDKDGMASFYASAIDGHDIEGTVEDSLNLFGSNNNRTYNLYRYKNQTDNYWQNHGQFFYSRKINQNISVNTGFHFTHGEGYYEQFKANEKFSKYGLADFGTITRTNLIRRLWLNNNFYGTTFSVNYSSNNTDLTIGGSANRYDGNHYGRVMQTLVNNAQLNHEWYHGKGIKSDYSAFGKINFRPVSNLSLYADMQIRRIDYKISGMDKNYRNLDFNPTYNFFNPKAGINYTINSYHTISFITGIAHKEATRANFVDAKPGDPLPTSEQLYDTELGYKLSTVNFLFNVNLFYMDYKDQLVLTGELNDVGDAMMINVPSSFRKGIEFESAYKATSYLRFEANTTLSENKINNYKSYLGQFEDDGSITKVLEKDFKSVTIAFSPSLISSGAIIITPIKNLDINWQSKYVSKQYIDNTENNGNSLNDYWVNNLTFSFKFKAKYIKDIFINVMINNILNEEYISNAWIYRYMYAGETYTSDGYFPQAGRNFLAGLTFKF